ncbi:MAG: hypothetical protein AB1941_11015 [Gemmatimonadota bacterium]
MSQKKRRHREPTFAQSLTPPNERRPRVAPGSDRSEKPVWLLQKVDFDGPWCWKKMDIETMLRVWGRLSSFETMTFGEIEGKKNHSIPKEQLCPRAQERLREIELDDYDAVLSLRVTKQERVWGIKTTGGVLLLWWDPEHSVYPMNIADN